MAKPEIVFCNNKIVVVIKPVGVPSQKDPTGAEDLISLTSAMLSERGENSSLWLVHRLDRNVGGLMVFARTKQAAAELSEIVANGKFQKKYLAVCQGNAEAGEYCDYLFKDSRTNRAYIVKSERKGTKKAILSASPIAFREDKTLLEIELKTGRFHQIRAQLSSRGHSLLGDKKYGNRDSLAKSPALFAFSICFCLGGREMSFSAVPSLSEYPWSIFEAELGAFFSPLTNQANMKGSTGYED